MNDSTFVHPHLPTSVLAWIAAARHIASYMKHVAVAIHVLESVGNPEYVLTSMR
jgi:hypothetical protein